MIPPRWVFRVGWAVHRAVFAISGGRIGTSRPAGNRVGVLFLETTGRQSGQVRRVGLNYLEDGPNLAVMASNAGAATDPGWWRNLQARPEATVDLGGRRLAVRGRAATGEERARLWPQFVAADASYEGYRRATTRELPVVVLEPVSRRPHVPVGSRP